MAEKRNGDTLQAALDAASYEEAVSRLEQTVTTLESGTLPLEEALRVFEAGVRWSRRCQERLGEAEQRVRIVLKQSGGEAMLAAFEGRPETPASATQTGATPPHNPDEPDEPDEE